MPNTISAGDDENKHTFAIQEEGYFTGFILNRDASNIIRVSMVSEGKETQMPLIPGVLQLKNQKVETIKISLDPTNAAATAVPYEIQGKVHVPETDPERMYLESDSEFFFRPLSQAGSLVLIADDETAGTLVNNTVAETISKQYTLAPNNFSNIFVEADTGTFWLTKFSAGATTQLRVYIGATVFTRTVDGSATFTGGSLSIAQLCGVRGMAALKAGGLIKVTIQPGVSSGQQGGQTVSLRVWGVV